MKGMVLGRRTVREEEKKQLHSVFIFCSPIHSSSAEWSFDGTCHFSLMSGLFKIDLSYVDGLTSICSTEGGCGTSLIAVYGPRDLEQKQFCIWLEKEQIILIRGAG